MKNTCPFYIVFQVLNIHLIKICKIVELPDLLFLVVFISFYSSRYHFHKFLELHSEIIRKNHQKHWTSPSGHNCQQKTLCHISTTFPNCQNYRLGHVEKIKSAIIKANHEVSCQCLSRGLLNVSDIKKKCSFEVYTEQNSKSKTHQSKVM